MTLVYLVAAWAAGILFATQLDFNPIFLGGLAAVAFATAYLLRAMRTDRLLLIALGLGALGALRYDAATGPLPEGDVARYVGAAEVTLTGVIVAPPDDREAHTNLEVRAERLTLDGTEQAVSGRVLVQAPPATYAYGDRVAVSGPLLTPPEFDDFSYRDYLARRRIHTLLPAWSVEVLSSDRGAPWLGAIYDLRARAERTITALLPSPQAPLLAGILLGIESDIPEDVREDFNRTGTSHVIAISGANIVVVIRALMGLLAPLAGRKRAVWLTALGVAAYAVLAGGDPAVVRAAIMGVLALAAARLGRRAWGLTSLVFVVLLMTLWNPLVLWDVGFQLSVAATAGLVLFSGDLERAFERLLARFFAESTARRVTRWLSEPLMVGIAAQIVTTPLILYHFGRLSLVSLLPNLFVVPVQPYIMILGWLAVLAGLLIVPLGEAIAGLAWLPLTWTLAFVEGFARWEWASVPVSLSAGATWAIYGALAFFGYIRLQHPDDRRALWGYLGRRFGTYVLLLSGAAVAALLWMMALTQPDGKLHVWFLDVGEGGATLIETPGGAQVLIDGGRSPQRLRGAVGDALPFWDRTLDTLIVTRPEASTIEALPALLERYRVQLVVDNGGGRTDNAYTALLDRWAQEGVPVIAAVAGGALDVGDGVRIEFLHPQPGDDTPADDAAVLVRVCYGDTTFLLDRGLTGDAERAALSAGWYVGSTVIELSSGGSDRANGAAFLRAAQPQAAVVAVAAGNRSGLPHPAVLDRLVQQRLDWPLYRTDRDGTIEMVTDGHLLWVYSER